VALTPRSQQLLSSILLDKCDCLLWAYHRGAVEHIHIGGGETRVNILEWQRR
jgi:hypothetical protein